MKLHETVASRPLYIVVESPQPERQGRTRKRKAVNKPFRARHLGNTRAMYQAGSQNGKVKERQALV
jgi:hypothetical protein